MFDILLLLCVKKNVLIAPVTGPLLLTCSASNVCSRPGENKLRLDLTNWGGRLIGSILNVGNSKQFKNKLSSNQLNLYHSIKSQIFVAEI